MEKLLLKLKSLVDKDLNEYIKWVILIALYVFYRMMEKVYDEKYLVFLVIPLIFLAVCTFIIDWIIDPMIESSRVFKKSTNKRKSGKTGPAFVSILFLLSILLFIIFYIYESVSLVNAAWFSLLSAALLALILKEKKTNKKSWKVPFAIALILLGSAGLIHSLVYNNGINSISFVFYTGFILLYFLKLFIKTKSTSPKPKD